MVKIITARLTSHKGNLRIFDSLAHVCGVFWNLAIDGFHTGNAQRDNETIKIWHQCSGSAWLYFAYLQ